MHIKHLYMHFNIILENRILNLVM